MNRNAIKLVRFRNGDTIICSFSTEKSESVIYVLERPMQINMLPVVTKKGIQSMTIFMQEWMEYSKDNIFKIPENVVMLVANPEEELIDEYLDALEKNDMHRIQREFEDISKNYDKKDGNYSDLEYNNTTDDDEYYEDESDDEEDDGLPEEPD